MAQKARAESKNNCGSRVRLDSILYRCADRSPRSGLDCQCGHGHLARIEALNFCFNVVLFIFLAALRIASGIILRPPALPQVMLVAALNLTDIRLLNTISDLIEFGLYWLAIWWFVANLASKEQPLGSSFSGIVLGLFGLESAGCPVLHHNRRLGLALNRRPDCLTCASSALAKRTFLRDRGDQRAVLFEDHAARKAAPTLCAR
jgi:hypothetical protein